jgi:hypothetical protein
MFRAPARVDAATLDDTAVIQGIAAADMRDAVALANEAGRRRLVGAVPELEKLCRRFIGFGRHRPVAEQVAAMAALGGIGGQEATETVGRLIAERVIEAPGLPAAIAVAAALGSRLPTALLLACLRDAHPAVRRDACRLARPGSEVVAVLLDLLNDLHDDVTAAAACALARMGREEGRPRLLRRLADVPSADLPSAEVIDAFARIADDDGVVVLGRLARRCPALAGIVLEALDESELALAARVAAGLRRQTG